jgi:hypothetical protein
VSDAEGARRCQAAAEARAGEMQAVCEAVRGRLAAEKRAREEVQAHCRDMLGLVEKQRSATEASRAQLLDLQKEVSELLVVRRRFIYLMTMAGVAPLRVSFDF